MKLELNDIHTLIGWVTENGVSLLEYEDAGMKIKIGGAQTERGMVSAGNTQTYSGMDAEHGQPCGEAMNGNTQAAGSMAVGQDINSGAGAASGQPGTNVVSSDMQTSWSVVESPLVGTFFAAPAEDAQPYVQVGDTVKKGQAVGIVEAMKLMNEIEAECDGVVEEILVKNEQMVEFGQPLMKIRPL